MKIIDPWQQKNSRLRKILFIIFSIVFIIIMLLPILFLLLIFSSPWEKTLYKVHHPAIYSVQKDFFQLADTVYCMEDGYCLAFDEKKETKRVDLKHFSKDFYVSKDILYVYLEEHIYAYNSKLEEICAYDTGYVSGHRHFIVIGDYIYYLGHIIGKGEVFYRYSIIYHTKEELEWDGKYPAVFRSEGLYFKEYFKTFDDNESYFIDEFSRIFYTENYEKIKIKRDKFALLINDKSFDIGYSFCMVEQMYINSENFFFATYHPNYDNCSNCITPCISQLTDVKLWKYNIKTEQLSLIKQFNDHTILISFDDNNYHYYFDGKLYSNDIEVEEAPKIEVGDIFSYYASFPGLMQSEIQKSFTKLAYISGKFYLIHKEINSDIEEFYGW